MMISCAKPTGQDRRRKCRALVLALIGALLTTGDSSAPRSASAAERGAAVLVARNSSRSAESAAQIKKLIEQLGDEVFAVREEATNRLIRSGIEAKPMLLGALSNPDAEVRARARRVLEIVVEGDFQRRLKAFADDADGSLGLTMPGWDAFKQLVGGDRAARTLFVEMQQAEPMLLEAYENGDESAGRVLTERLQSMQNVAGRLINRGGRPMLIPRYQLQPSLGTSMALLLVASDESTNVKPEVADLIRSAMTPQDFQTTLMANDDRSQVCRKVVGRWVVREVSDNATQYNIDIALTHNMPEGLIPAVRVLENLGPADDAFKRQLRYSAAVAVGNFGNRSHLPLIEPLLEDEAEVYNTIPAAKAGLAIPAARAVGAAANRILAKTQVRDVALAASIKLSEQDPAEFGFDMLKLTASKHLPKEGPQSRMGFRNDEEREAAFQKWEQWQKEQPQTVGKQSNKDTVER